MSKNDLNILDLVHFDLCLALSKMNDQIESQQYKIFYISSNREIIDADEFTNYLEITSIKNYARIKDILKKANLIVELYNEEFKKLEETAENHNYSIQLNNGRLLKIGSPFECLNIEGRTISYVVKSKSAYDYFFNNSEFRLYLNKGFALKSAKLINIITAFYPNESFEGSEAGAKPILEAPDYKLIDLFEKTSDYFLIINILVEKGHIHEKSYLWIDLEKGWRGLLIAILKDLKNKGYFKREIKITNQTYLSVAQNTFGQSISLDTIKKSNPANQNLEMIPNAS
jgi:hypothetical protein